MALKTSQLNSARAEFDWSYMGEDVHVVYNPQMFTPAMERRINEAINGKTEARAEALVFMLRSMLIDWDLVKDEVDPETNEPTGVEVPFGTSEDAMMELPVKFLGDAIEAIAGEIQAKGEEGKASGATSPPTVP